MSKPNYQSKQPKIGVSILTLFWIIFPFLPNYGKRLNAFCKETGLGLQLVPFWMMSKKDIATIDPGNVISYEGVWNDQESFWQWIKRLPGDPAALLGPFFFGFQKQSNLRLKLFDLYFPNAFAIDVPEHRNYLMETSETNWYSVITHIEKSGSLCFDTWHIRGNLFLENSKLDALNEIKQRIETVANHIKLVHCQTRNTIELWDFSMSHHNGNTILADMLEKLVPIIRQNIPIIIELKPISQTTIIAMKESIEQAIFSK